jgi:hypothetical protein
VVVVLMLARMEEWRWKTARRGAAAPEELHGTRSVASDTEIARPHCRLPPCHGRLCLCLCLVLLLLLLLLLLPTALLLQRLVAAAAADDGAASQAPDHHRVLRLHRQRVVAHLAHARPAQVGWAYRSEWPERGQCANNLGSVSTALLIASPPPTHAQPTMHPPLAYHLHPKCVDVIKALEECHKSSWARLSGGCNEQRRAVDRCLGEEVMHTHPDLPTLVCVCVCT